MTTSTSAVTRPASAEVRAIVDRAIDRYIAARHAKVAAFVDGNYGLIGSLRLHRKAFGLDLLRAPANVALALPYVASQLAAAGLDAAGADRLANRIRRQKMFFDTDVAHELTWRLHTDLLELPYDDGRRRSDRDALTAEILADGRVAAALDTFGAALVRAREDPVFRQRLQEKINTYMQSRTAAAELANNVVLASAGATLFKQLTPGALSLGPVLAGAVAQQAAIASFPLGAAAGSLWYGLFSPTPSGVLVAGMTGGLIGLGAVVTAFAGVLTDPLQRAFGVHRRRLHRLQRAGRRVKGRQTGLSGARPLHRSYPRPRRLGADGLSGRQVTPAGADRDKVEPMCGRYSQRRSWSDLVRLYNITADQMPLNLPPRFNIAPTQDVPVVRSTREGDGRELVLLRWGLVPFWAKDVVVGYKMINARAETIDEKPAFRYAFRQRRCLVVADGFYEWAKTPAGRKQPYFITVAGDRPFAFAGLWESWNSSDGERIESCTIVVTQANDTLRPIHDRMPAILDGDHFDSWLYTKAPLAEAKALLRPYPGAMTLFPVSSRVNAVRNDDPDCLAPMDLLSCPVTRPEVPYNPAAG